MKRLLFAVTIVLAFVSGAFAQSLPSPHFKWSSLTTSSDPVLDMSSLGVTGTVSGTNWYPINIIMTDDTDSGAGNYVSPMQVIQSIGTAGTAQGGKPGATFGINVFHNSAAGNPAPNYVALSSVALAATADNNTAGNSKSALYGFNPYAHLLNGATNWAVLAGMEVDATIDSGASVYQRHGIYISSGAGQSSGQGMDLDASIAIAAPEADAASGWRTGILFDDSTGLIPSTGGNYPIIAGGTLIQGGFGTTVSRSLYAGIDFSMLTTAWGTGGDAIILPANNGGISFGASHEAGRILSNTSSGGGDLLFGNSATSLRFSGTPYLTVSTSAITTAVQINAAGLVSAQDSLSKISLTPDGAGNNYLQSGNANFSGSAPLIISGAFTATAPSVEIKATATKIDGTLTAPNLATSGTAHGSLCVDSAGNVYVKTTTGACL